MNDIGPAIPSRSDLDWCWYLRRQGRIGEALERVLHDIGVMNHSGWPDWQPSVMTDTGAPVEMLLTGHQASLSLRTEVADPATDPETRVAKVCAIMKDLGHSTPPPAMRDVISAAQTAGPLTFGAWLGLRRCNRKLGSALYAEIPDTAADIARLLLSDSIAATITALGDDITAKMVGYTAWNGDITLSFDTTLRPADIVPVLAGPAQVSAEPVLNDIGVMIQAGAAFGDPQCVLSFSYTVHRDNPVPSLVLEVSSKAMFGNDTHIGAVVRSYTGEHMETYTGLADLLLPAPGGKTHHGKIGLHAQGNECPTLSIGVAAPWLSMDDATPN